MSPGRAVAGTKGHQHLQTNRPAGYLAEEAFSFLIERRGFTLELTGRIDGIFTGTSPIIIEEIKTTERELQSLEISPNPSHTAQLYCYGYIYSSQHDLSEAQMRLTYIQLETEEVLEIDKTLSFKELESFFLKLLDLYLDSLADLEDWRKNRDRSIREMEFPYGNFREGQRQMSVRIFRAIRDDEKLFVQAPTGTGKTIAALFPAVKNLAEGHIDRIFYLTARTLGRTVAEKALNDMRNRGLKLKSVVLTAKEKICFQDEVNCDPKVCPYALDYYDKLKNSLQELLSRDHFNKEILEELGRNHGLCPFELSLDMALYCDCLICDYNYVFDPRVYLKRFFEHVSESYTFLIDETHNLPDRARSMYSASLTKSKLMEVKRAIKEDLPEPVKKLQKINRLFLDEKNDHLQGEKRYHIMEEAPDDFIKEIRRFLFSAEKVLSRKGKASWKPLLQEFFYECSNFIKMSELYDDNYVYYSELLGKTDVMIKLFCTDPAPRLTAGLKRAQSAVFFSATLLPLNYFHRVLLGKECEAGEIMLPSPFPRENLNILIQNRIATAYRSREKSYAPIAGLIEEVYQSLRGNWLIFFPSFRYMEAVLDYLQENGPEDDGENDTFLIQDRKMDEGARDDFLSCFTEESSILGFAVTGGIFAEGIDLTGKRLTGVIAVGVGLPQLCLERDLIRSHFADLGEDGFAYSYQLPGFNRVMQAAGRLIRTESDRGNLILIDERFTSPRYRNLFPPEWQNYRITGNTEEILQNLTPMEE